jgi:GDSL-like Lipase/Acylhydrolase family
MLTQAQRIIAFALTCAGLPSCRAGTAPEPANAAPGPAARARAAPSLAPGANAVAAGVFPPGVTKPRIMIVGDSIAAGPGCYKKYLLQDLIEHHYSSFEFVGEYTDDCGSVRHSAVSCSTAEQYTQTSFTMPNCFQGKTFPGLSRLMATHHPDLLMLQLGVNDIWGGKRSVDQIVDSYTTLVRQARAENPRVVLVVAPRRW